LAATLAHVWTPRVVAGARAGAHVRSDRVDAADERITETTGRALIEIFKALVSRVARSSAVASVGTRTETTVHAAVFARGVAASLSITDITRGTCGTQPRALSVAALGSRIACSEVFHEALVTVQIACRSHPACSSAIADTGTDTWCGMLAESSGGVTDGDLAVSSDPSWGGVAVAFVGCDTGSKVLAAGVTDWSRTVDTSVTFLAFAVVGRGTSSIDTPLWAVELVTVGTSVSVVTFTSAWGSALSISTTD